jgi:hypothetical protein
MWTHLLNLALHYKVHDSLQAPYDTLMQLLPWLGALSLQKVKILVSPHKLIQNET